MNLYAYQVCLESSIFLFQMTRKKNLIKTINISVVHHMTLFHYFEKLNFFGYYT